MFRRILYVFILYSPRGIVNERHKTPTGYSAK